MWAPGEGNFPVRRFTISVAITPASIIGAGLTDGSHPSPKLNLSRFKYLKKNGRGVIPATSDTVIEGSTENLSFADGIIIDELYSPRLGVDKKILEAMIDLESGVQLPVGLSGDIKANEL